MRVIFFREKHLLVNGSELRYERMSELVSKGEMYVCQNNQIAATINNQSNTEILI